MSKPESNIRGIFKHFVLQKNRRACFHELGYTDPSRIVLHFGSHIEFECFILNIEVQPGKGVGISIEKLGRFAPNDAI